MPHALASAPSSDPGTQYGEDLLLAYLDYLASTGRGNASYVRAARAFFARWPDPRAWAAEPLEVRLAAGSATRPIITWLMLHRRLAPGYDYLLERKLSTFWREIKNSPLAGELDAFMNAAAELGFTERVRFATGSQVPARLLIQTGRRLDQLQVEDLAQLRAACHDRQQRIFQCVPAKDGQLWQTFGPGGTDIILRKDFEHAGTCQPGNEGCGHAGKCKGRQDDKFGGTPHSCRQQIEPEGKDIDENRRQNKTGNGNSECCEQHDEMIRPPVMVKSAGHACGNSDQYRNGNSYQAKFR